MNREIKFRAWGKKNETMIDLHLITPLALSEGMLNEGDGLFIPFREDIELMQFTGLKDKNGKEIYEGDIVRILYTDWPSKSSSDMRTLQQYLNDISWIGTVVWDSYKYSIKFKDLTTSIEPGQHGFIEIIGNIYETPDLLIDKL